MKKLIVFAILMTVSATSFSQQTDVKPKLTKDDYLKKSKTGKKVANKFLVTGASCVLTAYLIPKGKEITRPTGGSIWGVSIGYTTYKNYTTKGLFFLTGVVAMMTSVPIYLSSHRNKKKGMRLSFKNETIPQLQNGSFTTRTIPSLAMKIGL